MFSIQYIPNLRTKQLICQIFVTVSIPLFYLGLQKPGWAQLSPDNSLGTQINQSGNVFEITGGQQAGANLFHSFREFSVPTGGEAFFKNVGNVDGVKNIIGRVTGGLTSNIDGLIRENYGANLILLNPSGINFGPNAQLNISGSFLGSTANSILFEDGTEFSAINPQSQITVKVPLGLQMGENSAPINVEGIGHNLSIERPFFSPFIRGDVTGLKVDFGQTLALIGGNINLDGGIVIAEGGVIELGSVGEGLVNFTPQENGWIFSYQGISDFGNLNLRSQALVDTSGVNSGSIHLQGKQISIQDGSAILIQNQGNQPSKSLKVEASDILEVSGTNADGSIASNLFSETLNSGTGGDIIISTPNLIVKEGAVISAATFGQANGGQITIDAPNSVEISGFSPINPTRFSNITAATFGEGNAGNVTLSTQRLTNLNGGNIASVTGGPFGTGTGGNVTVNATESVELIGVTPAIFTPSQITAGSGGSGNAGNVTVNTQSLIVRDGGRVDASATATGDAGSVTVNATKSTEVNGRVAGSLNPSLIISSANILDETLRQILGLPDVPSGNSGNVTINTPQLTIDNGGQVTVRNDGSGDAGKLEVNANSIFLNNQGSITAATKAGKGGNINLQVLNDLQLNGFSQISSDNLGSGDSGDLTIATDKLTIGKGAFISAITIGAGKGANVNIFANNSVEITGTGFEEFQQTFQAGALLGKLLPTDRGTGIFLGTASQGASGHLTIETPSLLLDNGAVIFNPTFAEGIGGNIFIDASESVELIGSAIQTGTSPNSTGASGKIEIDTGKLILRDGATIVNPTLGNGAGGNVEISALESIELRNSPVGALLLTGIYTNTALGSGAGGDIRIDTAKLSIQDGVIGSNTGASLPTGVIPFGGPGGNVIVNASESVELSGIRSDTRFPSGLGSTGFSQSRSGNVTIFTKKLIVSEGADVSTAALGAGQGGTLNINASESIELTGTTVGDLTLGGLSASSGRVNLPELEATGASGDIKVTTQNLIVRDGASIDVQSLGSGDAGNLEIVADSILLDNQGTISANSRGVGNPGNMRIKADLIFLDNESSISAEVGNIIVQNESLANTIIPSENNGAGEEIAITSKELVVQGGGNISTATFSNKRGANIAINASESVQVRGASPTNPTELSFISSSSFGTGDSGDVSISTGKLSILNGGIVGAGAFGVGKGGDITVNATESVAIIGIEPTQLLSSVLGGSTLNAGNAGDVIINTPQLIVQDGGRIDSSTAATGNAGSITINASKSVEVSGTVPETNPVSQISSSGIIEDEFARQLFGLPPVPSGNSGNVTINTPQLKITDRAVVSAKNEGLGNAGILEVSARQVLLDNRGSLSAATTSGEGGNINLRTNFLLMDGNSELSATAQGTGNGGNIVITNLNNDNFVVLQEGSQIAANAFQGKGGNIQINARGVFVCSDCQISASSDLGLEGVVEIRTPETNNNLQFVNLPQEVVQPEDKMAIACSSQRQEEQSQFIVTGRGGLPPRPTEPLSSEALMSIESPATQSSSIPKRETATLPPPARGWYVNKKGLVILASQAPEIVPYDSKLTKQECYGN